MLPGHCVCEHLEKGSLGMRPELGIPCDKGNCIAMQVPGGSWCPGGHSLWCSQILTLLSSLQGLSASRCEQGSPHWDSIVGERPSPPDIELPRARGTFLCDSVAQEPELQGSQQVALERIQTQGYRGGPQKKTIPSTGPLPHGSVAPPGPTHPHLISC